MTMDQSHLETLGIAAASDKLGPLVSRAVHANRPTRIKRSADEHAVLISDADYADLVELRRARELAQVRELMAAAGRGEVDMTVYTSRDEAYADLGLGGADR